MLTFQYISRYIHSLLPRRGSTDTSADDTGKLLAAHLPYGSHSKADQEHQTDSKEGDEPELNTDVLLLTSWTSPLCRLLSILVLHHCCSA